jgi:hypothetical protein
LTEGSVVVILILSAPSDQHADHIERKLHERGAAVVRVNPAQFPAEAALSVGYSPTGEQRVTLRLDRGEIDLSQISAAWLRRPEWPVASNAIPEGPCREYVTRESRAVIDDALHNLDCGWLPGTPMAVHNAQRKLSQLKIAGEIGFEIPPTLITTNPDDLLDFYQAHNGRIVSKLADLGFFQTVGKEFARYTEPVTRRDIGYADSVRFCPMIFQASVPKRLELRVTVVGDQTFAAEIHSQESNHTRYDWRHYDKFQTTYLPHDLPDDVRERCLRLLARFGLTYGAIDFILTPDGRYVFLEINPSGQYLWIEGATGLPISDAICDLLIAGPRPRSAMSAVALSL